MKKMRKTIAFLLMLVLMLAAAPASFAEDTEAIDSEPLITDLRYIPGENADELWTHVGYSFLLGNGSSQEGNSFEVTYSDGTMKIFKYAYYKDYGDGGRLQTFLDLFENGVVSKDSEGRYKTLHVSSIIDDTSHAGISKVRFRVYSGNEYVYSSESYDVQVYGAMSSIKYEAPSPLTAPASMIGKGTGAMDDIDFFQEGAKITVYYEDGSSDVFYPAKVIDGNSSMTAFTLNGFENGEQLPLFWNCYSSGGLKAGANEVELRADWHHIETECYCTVTVDKPAAASMAANPLTIKAKTAMVKYSKLKKKAQTLAVTNVMKFTKDAKDKKTYTLSSAKKGSKSFKKYFKISKTTGKVTVKKGLKKGTYKVKVKVKALGNSKYKASGTKTVTFTIKVK